MTSNNNDNDKVSSSDNNKNNIASIEFMNLMNPLYQKAAELGIFDADTTEFTDRFQAFIDSFLASENIQLHSAAVRVINEWLTRTGQSIPSTSSSDGRNLKLELVLLVFSMLLDERMKFLEEQYSSLLEELEKRGLLEEKRNDD